MQHTVAKRMRGIIKHVRNILGNHQQIINQGANMGQGTSQNTRKTHRAKLRNRIEQMNLKDAILRISFDQTSVRTQSKHR